MTDKSPAAAFVFKWRFLSSETLEFEGYCLIIGFGGCISTKECLDLTIVVCSNPFCAIFWEKVICSDMNWFDLSFITLGNGTDSWGDKGFEFDSKVSLFVILQ